jgi:hypothetical protein
LCVQGLLNRVPISTLVLTGEQGLLNQPVERVAIVCRKMCQLVFGVKNDFSQGVQVTRLDVRYFRLLILILNLGCLAAW